MIVSRRFNNTLRASLLPLVFLSAFGCGTPRENDVKAAFLQEHPGANVFDVHVDEGDMFSVYFHIAYRKPDEEKVYGDIWLYMKDIKGDYKIHSKWTLPEGKAHED